MEEYLEKRQRLIVEDRSQRVDQNTDYKLSSEERRADEILKRIRKEEGETIWGKEQLYASEQPFPGMEFLTGQFFRATSLCHELNRQSTLARDTILGTKVYDILSHVRRECCKDGARHANFTF